MGSLRSLHHYPHQSFHEIRPPTDEEFVDACIIGDMRIVQQMLKDGANVNARSICYKITPLMWAVHKQFKEIVILLINHGADVNLLTSRNKESALFYAQGNEEITKILLDHGAKPQWVH